LGATSGDKSVMQLMMEADVDRTRAMAERDGLEEAAAAMAAEGETDAGGGLFRFRRPGGGCGGEGGGGDGGGGAGGRVRAPRRHGRAVQVAPIKPVMKAPRINQRWKLKYEELLSNFGFTFSLRRYAMGADAAPERARAVLRGLRFTAPQVDDPISALSGGWRVGPSRLRPPRQSSTRI